MCTWSERYTKCILQAIWLVPSNFGGGIEEIARNITWESREIMMIKSIDTLATVIQQISLRYTTKSKFTGVQKAWEKKY